MATALEVKKDTKQMESILSGLNHLRMELGLPTQHVRLGLLLDAAIEEANAIASEGNDYLDHND